MVSHKEEIEAVNERACANLGGVVMGNDTRPQNTSRLTTAMIISYNI